MRKQPQATFRRHSARSNQRDRKDTHTHTHNIAGRSKQNRAKTKKRSATPKTNNNTNTIQRNATNLCHIDEWDTHTYSNNNYCTYCIATIRIYYSISLSHHNSSPTKSEHTAKHKINKTHTHTCQMMQPPVTESPLTKKNSVVKSLDHRPASATTSPLGPSTPRTATAGITPSPSSAASPLHSPSSACGQRTRSLGASDTTRVVASHQSPAGSPTATGGRGGEREDVRVRTRRLMLEARSQNKDWRRPSSTFRSSTPRLAAPRMASTQSMYCLDKPVQKLQKSGWGVSKVPQREEPRRLTDKFYDPKLPDDVQYIYKGVQSVPSTPRMPPTPNNKVPPVGRYTSPFISCGMGM